MRCLNVKAAKLGKVYESGMRWGRRLSSGLEKIGVEYPWNQRWTKEALLVMDKIAWYLLYEHRLEGYLQLLFVRYAPGENGCLLPWSVWITGKDVIGTRIGPQEMSRRRDPGTCVVSRLLLRLIRIILVGQRRGSGLAVLLSVGIAIVVTNSRPIW